MSCHHSFSVMLFFCNPPSPPKAIQPLPLMDMVDIDTVDMDLVNLVDIDMVDMDMVDMDNWTWWTSKSRTFLAQCGLVEITA